MAIGYLFACIHIEDNMLCMAFKNDLNSVYSNNCYKVKIVKVTYVEI